VANVKERLTINKQKSQRLLMERFTLKNLNEVESKVQYRVQISYRFAALEDLVGEVEINSAWKTIRENIKISTKKRLGYYELDRHTPLFDEG
jgi:hypothetical protein